MIDNSAYKTIIHESNTIKKRIEEDWEDAKWGRITFQILAESEVPTIEQHRTQGSLN